MSIFEKKVYNRESGYKISAEGNSMVNSKYGQKVERIDRAAACLTRAGAEEGRARGEKK